MKNINAHLDLPFGKMQKIAFCFDVDGTLINNDMPFEVTQAVFKTLYDQKWKNVKMIVWSGGGADYARTQFYRHFPASYTPKFMAKMEHVDLKSKGYTIVAIDDIQDTLIGDANLIVRNK